MRNILTLDCELDNLGEAEQFLVQVRRIYLYYVFNYIWLDKMMVMSSIYKMK